MRIQILILIALVGGSFGCREQKQDSGGADKAGESHKAGRLNLTDKQRTEIEDAFKTIDPSVRSQLAVGILRELGDELYGAGISALGKSVSGASRDMWPLLFAKHLETRLILIPGCAGAFSKAAVMNPEERSYLLASSCPRGAPVVDPESLKGLFKPGLILVIVLEYYARDQGFEKDPLHRDLMAALLELK